MIIESLIFALSLSLCGCEKPQNTKSAYELFIEFIYMAKKFITGLPIIEKLFDNKKNQMMHVLRRSSTVREKCLNHDLTRTNIPAIDLIDVHGFKVESHTVLTKDGYFLELHRVLPTIWEPTKRYNKVVILQHGLMGNSEDWLLLGPNALPYLFSKAGYEVWLPNARGSKYSKLHTDHDEDSSKFWNFSFHEIGVYDLPAIIDYIVTESQSNKIHFVAYSMGATALMILLSTQPYYNHILRSATLLAPLVFMQPVNGPLKLLADFHKTYSNYSLDFLGVNEFMFNKQFPEEILAIYCDGDLQLCRNPYLLIANGGKQISNKKVRCNVLQNLPTGASMMTIVHYLQLISSGNFEMFDYGVERNEFKYGLRGVPKYDLSKIKVPIAVFSADQDWLCNKKSVVELSLHVSNFYLSYQIMRTNFSHTDFLWSDEASKEVYERIIEITNQLSENFTMEHLLDLKRHAFNQFLQW